MTEIWLLLAGLGLCLFLGHVSGFVHWLKAGIHTLPALIGSIIGTSAVWLGFYAFCLLIATSIAFGVNLVI